MDKKCAELIMVEMPRFVCHMRQNFCGAEMSGLTMQQQRVLSSLLEDSRSVTSLAEEMAVSLPAISRMTQQLIDAGWVKKEASKEDKRQVKLTLTKLGRDTVLGSRQKSYSKLLPMLEGLKEKEKKTIVEALEILKRFAELE